MDEQEEAARRALALDSTDGSALAALGMARAFRYHNVADGLEWLNKAVAIEPSNPEIFFSLAVLYRHAWMWDSAIDAIRIAERLDPLSPFYVAREAGIEVCADRFERALAIYRRAKAISATDPSIMIAMVHTLALLGRYDEAIAEWREATRIVNDTSLARALAHTAGKAGYLSALHFEGSRGLAKLLKQGSRDPLQLMKARIEAGDTAGGFAEMDKLIRARSIAMYRLPCLPDLDEIRGTAHFREILQRVGPLPQR